MTAKVVFLQCLLLLVPCVARADLTVGCAISLSDAITEISAAFTEQTGSEVRTSFAGSNVIARQIEAGAPIDVFVSADSRTMDGLEKRKLILPDSRRDIAGNRLVVIVPKTSRLRITGAKDLLAAKRIALADPMSVPAGIYAKTWLEKESLWREIQPRTVPLPNVRAALAAVETSNTEAAVTYRSDAASSEKVRVAFTVPEEKSGPIIYPAAITNASPRSGQAKSFVEFLLTEEARKILIRNSFAPPPSE